MVHSTSDNKCFKTKAYKASGVDSKLGSLPLIITAPHGGLSKPDSIPDRIREGSLLLADMYTKEIASGIWQNISNHYQYSSPYIVLNGIARRKADVNRPLKEGTETEEGEKVWKEYHDQVKYAIERVLSRNRHGLLVDIHGHTHSSDMIELGYLLSQDNLQSDSAELDQAILEKSSIQSVAKRYLKTRAPHQLLFQFGDSITNKSKNIISCLPSSQIPSPVDTNYFMGGFTTQHYHNYWDRLDVIQIEIPKRLRLNEKNRQQAIKILSSAIIQMLNHYYMKPCKL